MKTVTVDQFLSLGPCWGEERVRAFAGDKNEWTALDVLKAEGVSGEDKLWAVLREEFIDTPILHEFACRCAENALKLVDNPDPRSVNAIAVKRRWMRGEATDAELVVVKEAARVAARDAARAAARGAAGVVAKEAVWAAAGDAARTAAGEAARAAAGDAARAAAWAAATARDAARKAAMDAQAQMLIEMLAAEVE